MGRRKKRRGRRGMKVGRREVDMKRKENYDSRQGMEKLMKKESRKKGMKMKK